MTKWTQEEKKFLLDNFLEKGPDYCAKNLNRSKNAINIAACRLNLNTNQRSTWTEEDIKFLTQNKDKGISYCAEKLNRTPAAVQRKASKLNLTKDRWATEEEQFLIKNYPDHGPVYCAENLNRNYGEVCVKATRLGLKTNTVYKKSKIVYLFYFPELFLFKVGLTNCIERRSKSFGYKCTIIAFKEYNTYQEAAKMERTLINSVSLVNTGQLRNGNSETFKVLSKEVHQFLSDTNVQPDLFPE
jgi:hypothetical protein